MTEGSSGSLSGSGRIAPQTGTTWSAEIAPADHAHAPLSDDKTVISRRPSPAPAALLTPVKPADVGRSLVGETLGHFRLEEFIGGGGMGAVFRATDLTLERTVAVKVVSNDNADDEMLRRFRNEAQSAARLDHPNIARVYFVGQDKHWNYIVFEYIEGDNVRDLVERNGPLSVAEAVSYTLQVAEALEHASQRDVVHRDIKPSNILVMPTGRVKLVDMGLARLHQVDAPSQDVTATGVTLGTFDYISPEQARDPRGADVRSDLYSLGCTLYFMLTGSPPFPDGTVLQKLLSHSGDPPPDPRDARPDIDDELLGILFKLMAKQPGHRYQAPAELIQALLVFSEHAGIRYEGSPATLPAPPDEPGRRLLQHLPWLIPLGVLVSVVYGAELFRAPSDSVRKAPRVPPVPAQPSVPSPGVADGDTFPLDASVPPRDLLGTDAGDVSLRTGDERPPGIRETPPAASSGGGSLASPGASPTAGAPVAAASNPSAGQGPAATSSDLPATIAPESESIRPADAARGLAPTGASALSEVPDRSDSEPGVGVNPSATGATPAPAGAVVERAIPDNVLVVAPLENPSRNPRVVGSLEAALVVAQRQAEIDTILLRFDEHVERPLTWSASSEDAQLSIRADEGYSPRIVFRPSSGDMWSSRSMLQLIGGHVQFRGVHLRLEFDETLANEWFLFDLKQVQSITVDNSTLTIVNEQAVTTSFFNVAGGPRSGMMPDGMPSATEPRRFPSLELSACVVRGQANLVRAAEGLPFRFTWSQGFLATTEPAFYMRGLKDQGGPRRIDLRLERITASLQGNLCLVELDNSAPYAPMLKVESNYCVFRVGSPDIPLVEHRGVDSVDIMDALTRNLYTQQGDNNQYSADLAIVWRIVTRNQDERQFPWQPNDDWYRERLSEKYTPWRFNLPAATVPVHQYSPHDFLLERNQSSLAGFGEESLPALPVSSPPSPPKPAAAPPGPPPSLVPPP